MDKIYKKKKKKKREKKEKVSAYTPANHARIYIQEFQ